LKFAGPTASNLKLPYEIAACGVARQPGWKMIAPELKKAAYDLGSEIHAGKWSHVRDLARKPGPACVEIIEELQRRCPGFTLPEYQEALSQGLYESMW
jgi:hypothetical protein